MEGILPNLFFKKYIKTPKLKNDAATTKKKCQINLSEEHGRKEFAVKYLQVELKTTSQKIINEEQVGFLAELHGSLNICKSINELRHMVNLRTEITSSSQ